MLIMNNWDRKAHKTMCLVYYFLFVVGGHRFSVRFTPGKCVCASFLELRFYSSVFLVNPSQGGTRYRLDSDKELYFLSKSNHGHSI